MPNSGDAAADALREANFRYELATRAAKVGVWDWDIVSGGFYLDPNVKAILGYEDHEIPNDLEIWAGYVHEDDKEAVMQAATDHLEGKTDQYVFEHRMRHKDGSIRWVMVRGKAIRDDAGEAIRMVGTDADITDLKRAEDALRATEIRYRSVIEAIPDTLCEVDAHGKVLFCNRPGAPHAGAPNGDWLGRSVFELLGAPLDGLARPIFDRVFATGVAEESELSYGAEQDRSWRHVAVLPLAQQQTALVLIRDVTARKQAERLRHRFVERVISAQEDERRRVARELHDALGQILTGAALRLKALEDGAASDELAEDLAGVRQLTEHAIAEVAHIARQLRPPALDHRGLPAALEACVDEVRRSSEIELQLEIEGIGEDERFPSAVETALYRIAQEALANILKHSSAQRAEIALRRSGLELWLTITDDGRGVASPTGSDGHGLAGIQERASLLGGRVRVETAPGHGVTLEIRIPL